MRRSDDGWGLPSKRLRAERRNHVWALDFIFDSTADGRPIKALATCYEYIRENIGRQLGRSLAADEHSTHTDRRS